MAPHDPKAAPAAPYDGVPNTQRRERELHRLADARNADVTGDEGSRLPRGEPGTTIGPDAEPPSDAEPPEGGTS